MVSRRSLTALLVAATTLAIGGATAVGATPHRSHARPKPAGAAPAAAAPVADTASPLAVPGGLGALPCAGGSSPIKHVIYLQFDNTHLRRDRANVPSDLEQMPHLLNFLRGNGTLLANDHTQLISHTANGILTSLTGVYPDRHGQSVANSFRYYHPDGTTGTGVSFAYWTDGIFDPTTSTPSDTAPNMVTDTGKQAPAPWVPYTRAGCDFGAAGLANMELENTGPDVPKVFGAGSPEAQEAMTDPDKAAADFVGIAVHCAKGGTSVCAGSTDAKPDLLPDEPGGYTGFDALFGNKYVAPVISPNGPVQTLSGKTIEDTHGNVGFPGFDGMTPDVSLSYVAAMQEHGIPVTYAYLSDAHDNHSTGVDTGPYGPGEAGYVSQLHDYDQAFARFFDRLQSDGINRSNTLFVVTVEEGDHFAGGPPSNPSCDGVTTPCRYSHVTCPSTSMATCPGNAVGEVNVNLRGLLATQRNNTTPFDVHSDMAPAFYLTGDPARDATVTRTFEHDVAALRASNPYAGHDVAVSRQLIDPVGMRLLHMVTGDPLRTPTFISFLNPDMFGYAGGTTCTAASPCSQVQPGFAWNHGGLVPEVANTWIGMVGPGVRHLGKTHRPWTDHTDLRPTMLALAGLRDDYGHDGRAILSVLTRGALPAGLRTHTELVKRLGAALKQIDAPFGVVGEDGIAASTKAIKGSNAVYSRIENRIARLTVRRNRLADRIAPALDAATFDGDPVGAAQARAWIAQAHAIIRAANRLSR
jgi:hypothetical protein